MPVIVCVGITMTTPIATSPDAPSPGPRRWDDGPPALVCGTGEQPDGARAGRDQKAILLRVMVDIAADLDLDATLNRVVADRERIAHDLHDHVIQRLFAAGMDLQGTIARSRSSEITSRLDRTVTDLETTIEDIRTTIFDLLLTGAERTGFRQRIQAAVAESDR